MVVWHTDIIQIAGGYVISNTCIYDMKMSLGSYVYGEWGSTYKK